MFRKSGCFSRGKDGMEIIVSHREDGTSAVVWNGYSNALCGVRDAKKNREIAELIGLALFEHFEKRGVDVSLKILDVNKGGN
jgi:hypothetical protein